MMQATQFSTKGGIPYQKGKEEEERLSTNVTNVKSWVTDILSVPRMRKQDNEVYI